MHAHEAAGAAKISADLLADPSGGLRRSQADATELATTQAKCLSNCVMRHGSCPSPSTKQFFMKLQKGTQQASDRAIAPAEVITTWPTML